jgi:N-acyl-phosphatidylethanolamine-hydrolysing phospholipase D
VLHAAAPSHSAGALPVPRAHPWHDTAHHRPGGFRNPWRINGDDVPALKAAGWIASYLTSRRPPDAPTPFVRPSADDLHGDVPAGATRALWLGHTTVLLRFGRAGARPLHVLTDPVFAGRASPLPFAGPKREVPRPVERGALPAVDLVLLSHNHYDHLDLPSLAELPGAERSVLVTALGVGRYLGDLRFGRVLELGWHQQAEVAGLKITALPAIHFSKRGLFDRDATLWCGFLLEDGATGRRLYFSGDTAYGPVFPELARRYPASPDLALVPIGAYAPRDMMKGTHCTAEEGLRLGLDFGAKAMCAMHWGAIRLTDEPSFEPPERFRAAADAAGVGPERAWVLAVGETRAF